MLSYLTAFTVGLLGGVHCIAMCGGIVGALTLGLPSLQQGRPWRALPYHLAYNLGRIGSYALAGALLGGVGLASARLLPLQSVQTFLQAIAGVFMIALGLYLGGWWLGLMRIERGGAVLWRKLEPLARPLLPVRSLGAAWVVGGVWGWLPCGLVYSVLVMSLSAGGPVQGLALMLAFGLGTLPTLLAGGLLASRLSAFMARTWVREAAGVLVFLFGAATLAGAMGLLGPRGIPGAAG